jgi:hypothetical protein
MSAVSAADTSGASAQTRASLPPRRFRTFAQPFERDEPWNGRSVFIRKSVSYGP